MSEQNRKNDKKGTGFNPIGLCIGAGIGLCFGAAMNNMALGLCLGMGVGLCYCVALGQTGKKAGKKDEKEEKGGEDQQ